MGSGQVPLWTPKSPNSTPMSKYRSHVNAKFDQHLNNSQQLHKWSVENPHDFWIDLWRYVGLVPSLPVSIKKAYDDSKTIKDVPAFFEGVDLNYAENVFHGKILRSTALIGIRENDPFRNETWTWARLRENVRRARSALIRSGVKRGDKVGAVMSNCPWTIALFLACASFGAVFTSIAPEMGVEGIVGRLEQIAVRILFVDSHQVYKGKMRSMDEKLTRVVKALESDVEVVVVPILSGRYGFLTLDEFLTRSWGADKLDFQRLPFTEPLVIVYSSGTTGPPKCIVHHHGTVLNLKKVSILHNSLTPRDVVFQYTSTSWILWNIQNGHLAIGAPLVCYDGSPLYPNASRILQICTHYQVTYLGTSPRYLLELETSGIKPADFDLKALRMVTTTGATLTEGQFEWFYQAFPSDVHLSSVAGGTEISTSWLASDPAGPVYAAEMQIPALGHDVDVVDSETGASIKASGDSGELVCRAPFPSMPAYFYHDPDRKKYSDAYFSRFPQLSVWAQHDWIQFNPTTGGSQIHGRSDGTLNPSGIRFGSAEIYSLVEGPVFAGLIVDTLCVGRKRVSDRNESVFLFVKMCLGKSLTSKLIEQIKARIRQSLSPRHVPAYIVQIQDIPVTINGKKVEIVVKKIISGANVKVSATVSNPECLGEYYQYRDYGQGKIEAKL